MPEAHLKLLEVANDDDNLLLHVGEVSLAGQRVSRGSHLPGDPLHDVIPAQSPEAYCPLPRPAKYFQARF